MGCLGWLILLRCLSEFVRLIGVGVVYVIRGISICD